MSKQMFLCKEVEGNKSTFKLIPISLDSPYLEVRFSFERKLLSIITKTPMEEFRMMPKIDDNGNIAPSKVNKDGNKYERLRIQAFYDVSITNKEDIEKFVNLMTGETHDLSQYFVVPDPTIAPEDVKLTVVKENGDQTS